MAWTYYETSTVAYGKTSFTRTFLSTASASGFETLGIFTTWLRTTAGTTSFIVDGTSYLSSFENYNSELRSRGPTAGGITTNSSSFGASRIVSGSFAAGSFGHTSRETFSIASFGATTSWTLLSVYSTSFSGSSSTTYGSHEDNDPLNANGTLTASGSGTYNAWLATTTVTVSTTKNLTVSTTQATSTRVTVGTTLGAGSATSLSTTTVSTAFTQTRSTTSNGSWTTTTYASATFNTNKWGVLDGPFDDQGIPEFGDYRLFAINTVVEAASSEWLWVLHTSTADQTAGAVRELGYSTDKYTIKSLTYSYGSTWVRHAGTTATSTLTTTTRSTATVTITYTTTSVLTLTTRSANSTTHFTTPVFFISRLTSSRTTSFSNSFTTTSLRTSNANFAQATFSTISRYTTISLPAMVHDGDLALVPTTIQMATSFRSTISWHVVNVLDSLTPTSITEAVSETIVAFSVFITTQRGVDQAGEGEFLASRFAQVFFGGYRPATDAGTSRPRYSNWIHVTSGGSTASTVSTWSLANYSGFDAQPVRALGTGTLTMLDEVKHETLSEVEGFSAGNYFGGIPHCTTHQQVLLGMHGFAFRTTKVDAGGGVSTGTFTVGLQTTSSSSLDGVHYRLETEGFAQVFFVTNEVAHGQGLTPAALTMTYDRHKTTII